MNETTVTTPNELEIRVERVFDAPRAHVFSVWTDPQLIPDWWGDGTVVEEMDVRPGGTYRFRTALRRRRGRVPRGRAAGAARADVPEPPADARVRGSRRADEADADDALRHDRGARHDDAVRRRGGREGRLRRGRRGAAEDRSEKLRQGSPGALSTSLAARSPLRSAPSISACQAPAVCSPAKATGPTGARAPRRRAATGGCAPSTRRAPTGRRATWRAAAPSASSRGRAGAPHGPAQRSGPRRRSSRSSADGEPANDDADA